MLQGTKVASWVFGPAVIGLLISASAASVVGCKKDEPPPPLPTAAPTTTATPTAPLVLAPEVPVASAAPVDSAKKVGGTGVATSFANCCKALSQNAASAPEPTKTTMTQAAAMCNSMVSAGAGGPTVVTAIQGLLRGVGMPSACR